VVAPRENLLAAVAASIWVQNFGKIVRFGKRPKHGGSGLEEAAITSRERSSAGNDAFFRHNPVNARESDQ